MKLIIQQEEDTDKDIIHGNEMKRDIKSFVWSSSLKLKKSKKLLLDQWCFMMKILRWMCGVIRRDIEINVFICEQLDVASIKDKMRESLR